MSFIDRGQRGKQSYRLYRLPNTEAALPLEVPIAVHSLWRKGDYHERERSTEFWVELVTHGDVKFFQDGNEYLVKPVSIFLPRKGTTHRFTTGPSGRACKRSLCIQGLMLDAVLGYAGLDSCDVIALTDADQRASVLRLFKTSDRLLEEKSPGFIADLAATALGLLIRLGECTQRRRSTPVNRASHFMRQNVGRQVTDREIANAAGLSVTHFHRIFKAETATSPMRHFVELKMEHAKGILAMTPMSIKEVAYALGYEEPAYFTEVFRRVVGMSPSEFRARNQVTSGKHQITNNGRESGGTGEKRKRES